MPVNRPCIATALVAVGATLTFAVSPSWATHGNATYTCVDRDLELAVEVPLSTLSANFDTADFYLSGVFLAHMDRRVPGTVGTSFLLPVGVTSVDGKYDGPASHSSGPVPIEVTGGRPDCTPTPPPPTTSPTTASAPAEHSTTSVPARTTTTAPPASSSVPPGPTTPATSRTLPPTGSHAKRSPLPPIGGVLVTLGLGCLAAGATRRRRTT